MRWDKAVALLDLARAVAGSAEGLTLDEMAARASVDRRAAERMRDGLCVAFSALEENTEGRVKRFRLPGGIEAFFRAPTAD